MDTYLGGTRDEADKNIRPESPDPKRLRDYLRLRTIDDVITILIEIALDREQYYKKKIKELFHVSTTKQP